MNSHPLFAAEKRIVFPVGQYPRPPKVKVVYPHHIFILKTYSQNGRFFCLNLQSRMWHTLSLTKEFKQFRCRQNYAIPIQSHIKWMLLTAAKSIPQIMSNQSEEDTATKETLSLNQCLLSTGRGLSDLSTLKKIYHVI